jgi:hypothetical protein
MQIETALAILKYSPRESYLNAYYPDKEQNRINTEAPTVFDYTPGQKFLAENVILALLEIQIEAYTSNSYNGVPKYEETIRLLLERQIGSESFRSKISEYFTRILTLEI